MKAKHLWLLGFFIFTTSCFTPKNLNTQLRDTIKRTHPQPAQFVSPYDQMNLSYQRAMELKKNISGATPINGKLWKEYMGWMQAYETLYHEQKMYNQSLRQNGKITLEPGASYTFFLESFCVNAGSHRPVQGDGFRPGPLKGGAQSWLPKLLREYKIRGLSKDRTQSMIWALLSNNKFDQLNDQIQQDLLSVFPDARVRFGNSIVDSKAKSFLQGLIPNQVKEMQEKIDPIQEMLTRADYTFGEMEAIAAPILHRAPIAQGWVQMSSGYYMRTTSMGGYEQVRKDIYVPANINTQPVFDPTHIIEVPGQGQRIIATPNARDPKMKDVSSTCDDVKNRTPQSCTPMTDQKREDILAAADPSNFPRARYALPPNRNLPIEAESDCSTFTYEIYAREGQEYPMSTTHAMHCLQNFNEVPKYQAKPGDLILYDGHVGIYDYEDKVISSTRGGKNRRSTLDPDDPYFLPAITRYSYTTFTNPRFLQWTCPNNKE